MSEEQPILEMRGIEKSFFGVRVLKGVDFALTGGEVHALLGENGAGKSTLIKILNGDYSKDGGVIVVDGAPVAIDSPRDAEALGIRMIYQELHYAPDLSVAENLLLGHLPNRPGLFGPRVDWPQAQQIARSALQQLGIDLDPQTPMRKLSAVERQIVQIAKALAGQARILVMDEPTAALTPHEVQLLFGIIETLRSQGVAIIYISHRLDEIFQIAQRATVLRDGNLVGAVPVAGLTKQQLVTMMVGRDIGTVVLPEANIKIYLDASAEERAKRRFDEIIARGEKADYDQILKKVIERDHIDSTRAVAPLRPADDAVIIDSDKMDADQVFARVMELCK